MNKVFSQIVILSTDNGDQLLQYHSCLPITVERLISLIEREDGPVNWDDVGITFADNPRQIDLDYRESIAPNPVQPGVFVKITRGINAGPTIFEVKGLGTNKGRDIAFLGENQWDFIDNLTFESY